MDITFSILPKPTNKYSKSFHLIYKNPTEITEPPYQVKETGYAGFEIPIEIYFKNRDKQNHLVYVVDLCLLTELPNSSSKKEKLTFYNPNKDFERCLLKAGAQVISMTKDKKERSDSPPAKKQKSSSLIPSKDMSKQANQAKSTSNTTHHNHSSSHHSSSQQHHHHSKNSSQQSHSHSYHGHGANHGSHNSAGSSSNHTISNLHNNHSSQNHQASHHQSSKKSSSQQSLPKSKTSTKEFMDVFGAPLVINNNKSHKVANGRDVVEGNGDVAFTINESPPPIATRIPHKPSQTTVGQSHNAPKSTVPRSHHRHQQVKPNEPPQVAPIAPPQAQALPIVTQLDPFQAIQAKISTLTDCDRLQKIVDIIEESGEWFNLTPNKFEFDLKRLDKKTLHKIEKYL